MQHHVDHRARPNGNTKETRAFWALLCVVCCCVVVLLCCCVVVCCVVLCRCCCCFCEGLTEQDVYVDKSLRTNCARTLEDKGSENWLNSGTTRGARKMTQNASTQHRHGELVEIMSRFKVQTARRDTATRSINCAHFSILRNGEKTPRI